MSCGCDFSSAGDLRRACEVHSAVMRAANNPPRYAEHTRNMMAAALMGGRSLWPPTEQEIQKIYEVVDAMLASKYAIPPWNR